MALPSRSPVVSAQAESEQAYRLLDVDALRGFALAGILAVNIWFFADPYYFTEETNPSYNSGLDHAVRFLIKLVFETKFYLLFSFLFGYSFTLQMDAAERAKASFRARMWRRQIGLLLLGVVHGTIFYSGEILFLYALLGLVLLGCKGLSARRARSIGIGVVVLMGAVWLLVGAVALYASAPSDGSASGAQAMSAALGGSVSSTLDYHASHWFETFVALALIQGPSALAMFFLGFAAGRARVLETRERYRAAMRRILWIGAPLGVAGSLAYALAGRYRPGGGLEMIAYGLGQLTAPLLAASYVVAALMLLRTRLGPSMGRLLAPMGKMALTNYIGQSVMLGILFTGYGFRLIDRLPPLAVLALVPALFAAQVLLSRWWLERHPYGPGEWLLRAMTVAGIPPWSRTQGTSEVQGNPWP